MGKKESHFSNVLRIQFRQIDLTNEEDWVVAKDSATGIASQGKTGDEALANLAEALSLYYDNSETGCIEYETERLILKQGDNDRDNGTFLKMLREDGDFREFCGLEYSESRLCTFYDYLGFESYFSIFLKDNPSEMIGYVGMGYQHERYEAEFYLSKYHRNKGYCSEALKKILEVTKRGEMVWRARDGKRKIIMEKEVFASVISTNVPAIHVLEKCGFRKNDKGPVLIGAIVLDEQQEKALADYMISDYIVLLEDEIG